MALKSLETEIEPLAVDVRGASALLGCGEKTVIKALRSGQLPHVRISKRIFIRRDAIDAFLNASNAYRSNTYTRPRRGQEKVG